MLVGEAYTKTMRACLLTDAVLHGLLLQTTPGDPQQWISDDTYNEDRDDLLTELIDEEGADDTRGLQEPCATPNSLFSTLQKEYNGLLVNDTTVEYIKLNQANLYTPSHATGSLRPCEGKPEMVQNWHALAYVNANRGDYTNVH